MSGWAGLFRSKAPKAKPDPRIRWFGKLPTYADYYSSKTDEEWVVEFNDWIIKGYEIFDNRARSTNAPKKKLPMSGCIIRLPKSGMTVFASIQDYGGDMRGRPFPICFYAGFPTAEWPGPTSDRSAGALRVVQDLMALKREVIRFFNAPGRFDTVFGEREIDLDGIDRRGGDDSWSSKAQALPLADWFAGAKNGMAVDDLGTWLGLAARWGDNVAKLESEPFEPTFSFPLSSGHGVELQVAGWLRWLESRMDLKRRALSLVLTGEPAGEYQRLVVIAREVVSEDFLLLTPLARSLAYVDDLSTVKPSESDDGAAPGEGGNSPPIRLTNWAEFAEQAVRAT